MTNRQIARFKLWFRRFPVVLLTVACVASGIASLLGMRSNYQRMIVLRDRLVLADKMGTDVETPLRELRGFVYSHMNADLHKNNLTKPPIQLKGRYDVLVKSEQQRVKNTNQMALASAEIECGNRYPNGADRIKRTQCVQDYQASHATREQAVPEALYKFDFISPRFSADVAGYSILLFFASISLLTIRILMYLLVRRSFRG